MLRRRRIEMIDLSQSAANALFTVANVVLIVGAILTLVGTIGVVVTSGVRDRFADERARENEAKTAAAGAESARANESNTKLQLELERERSERLRLEQKVAPRQLTSDQRAKLLAALSSTGWKRAEIIWHGAGEPETYARDFERVFERAGIKTNVHTLGPFITRAWGLVVIRTKNNSSSRLAKILQRAGVSCSVEDTNDTFGPKDEPTLVVGTRED